VIRSFRRPLVAAAAAGVLSVGLVLSGGVAGAQSNEVVISGSSTVEPITSLVAELYAEENPDATIRVDGPGTGDGFQLFCNGETDVSDASRPIDEEEVAACEDNGVEYTELPVGIDGLTVVASSASKLKCLTHNDLYAIFGPESGGGTVDLADASALATELGGSKLPKSGSVRKFTPGAESGTYDSFIELGYQDVMDSQLEAGAIPADKVGTNDDGEQEVVEPLIAAGTFPNDNDIVKRVEGSENGLGFFGYAYYQANKAGGLKAVAIEDSETGKCVKPTAKTIKAGTYPISRTLYIYPNNGNVAENRTLKDFLDYYLTKRSLTSNVLEAGYVPLASADLQETIDAWKQLAT
jgi:phosphate transport system substrate-binding protein